MDQCGFVSPSENTSDQPQKKLPHQFLFLCERTRVAPFFDDDRIIRTYRTLKVSVSFVTGYGHVGKPLLVGLVLAGHADRGRRIFQAADALRPPGAIAVVFQNDRLLPWRIAIANVELGLQAMPATHRAVAP